VKSLALDMSKVPHMDSSGIAMLAFFHKKMKQAGSQFSLIQVTNDIMAILRLSSLDTYFTILPSEDGLK
jgi:anti-sigma B factor antagonist